MTNPYTQTATLPVGQVSRELQLPTQAPSVEITNTSETASVTVNAAGPALLDGSGTTLTPGASTTVTLQQANGGVLILSAVATAPGATVLVTMTPVTFDLGALVLPEPGAPQPEAPETP
jgi:hypothetical protein